MATKTERKWCSFDNYTCTEKAKWMNRNGVRVCEHHKLLLDAFTWELRNERHWALIKRR